MSYFPEDIPFMSEEERKTNGIKTAKEIETQKVQLSKEDATFDCVSRQAAIDALDVGAEVLRRVLDEADVVGVERAKYEWGLGLIESHIADVNDLPSAQPKIVMCKDCKWWGYKDDTSLTRMCHAAKHEYLTKHWEIYIHRRHKGDFYCADAERRTDE